MRGWTEETVRKAATWQAFKEGKSLFENGLVADAAVTDTGWQGSVRVGKRLMKVNVVVKSPTNLDTNCPCSDNQRTGAVCAHAVASALAALTGSKVGSARPDVPAVNLLPPISSAVSWQILLPLNWREALQRGRLAATLAILKDGENFPADDRLNLWLGKENVVSKSLLNLNLDGNRVSTFLESVSGHPRLIAGKEKLQIEIRSGERIQLSGAELQGGGIQLIPLTATEPWIPIGNSFWKIAEDSVIKAGEGTVPADLAGALASLAQGLDVVTPTSDFFGQLDSWQNWIRFPSGSWLDSLHFVPLVPVVELKLEGSLHHLEAQLLVKYDSEPSIPPGLGKVTGLPRLNGNFCQVRDLPTEELAVRTLTREGFEPQDYSTGQWVLNDEAAILRFLTATLPTLRKQWQITEGEKFQHVRKNVTVVSPRIDIIGTGNDWLTFDLKFQTDAGMTVPADEVRRLLRSGKGIGQSSNGKILIISDDILDLIDPMFADMDLRQEGGHFVASSLDGELVKEIRKKIQNDNVFNELQQLGNWQIPLSLTAELRDYQRLGAQWLCDRIQRHGGALLADDMGLGKTVQTIAVIEQSFQSDEDEPGVVLVVATASLLGNWKAEFARFAPARQVRILHGAGRDTERERVVPGEVVLTSYGTLARDLAWHLKRTYLAVIVDEASLMRNPDTDHAKAVAKLRATRRIALTGTPIENGIRDLWAIFRFIQPGWLGTREEFKEKYEVPISSGVSSREVMERLKLRTAPFLLRRTKEQVAPELPSKLFIDEFCDLSPDQSAVYKQLLVEARKQVDQTADSGNAGAARMKMLTALLRLRQTCCDLALLGSDRFNQLLVPRRSSKLNRLLELLQEAIDGGHRVLVFSQFQKQLLEIEKCIIERNWRHLRLDGKSRNRQELVNRFQESDGPPIFLISLKAGGYGLNLTAADTVIHFDPWWNPAAEAQATDRAHRIGQTRPVTVYRLLTRGTVEEKVVQLQARKRELASAIDEEGVVGDAVGWSMDDLKSVVTAD